MPKGAMINNLLKGPNHFIYMILFFGLSPYGLKAQQRESHLIHQNANDSLSVFFLHTDKDVYTPGSYLWMSAYLSEGVNLDSIYNVHLLLVDPLRKRAVASQDFVVENKRASGRFYIPDALDQGLYHLYAYTNSFSQNPKKVRVYRKTIKISGSQPYKIRTTGKLQRDSALIEITLQSKILPTAFLSVNFSLYAQGKPVADFKLTTDELGKLSFRIHKSLINKKPEISGQIRSAKWHSNFISRLRWSSEETFINFYPRGAKLISGKSSKMAFNIASTSGDGLSRSLALTENEKEISFFSSGSDGSGLINFIPYSGRKYLVKIKNEAALPLQEFPEISAALWQIDGSPIQTDSLLLEITGPDERKASFLTLGTNEGDFYNAKIKIPLSPGRFSLSTGLPPGFIFARLRDSLGNSLARKHFFINQKPEVRVSLSTDSQKYHPLSKVNLKLKISGKDQQPLHGRFSVSVSAVEKNNVNLKTDDPFRLIAEHEQGIEKALCFMDNLQDENLEFPGMEANASIKRDGYVLFDERPLKRPVKLLLLGKPVQIITTQKDGSFTLPHSDLRGEEGAKIVLSLLAKNPHGHRIVLEAKMQKADEFLSAQDINIAESFDEEPLTDDEKPYVSESGTILNEVTIKAISSQIKIRAGTIDSTGRCDDYVCYLGFLNCSSHGRGTPGQTTAIDGRKYLIDGLSGTEEIIYHCRFKGIQPYLKSLPVSVYPTIFPVFNPAGNYTTEKLTTTTLYWSDNIHTDFNGAAEVYFHTNKRSGRYLIKIFGQSENGFFNKQIIFEVNE